MWFVDEEAEVGDETEVVEEEKFQEENSEAKKRKNEEEPGIKKKIGVDLKNLNLKTLMK